MPWDIILGGITGLFGNIITAWSNYKTQKLKNEHDETMYQFKIQELGAKTDAAIKITEAKISGAVELADSKAYDTSQEKGNEKLFAESWIGLLLKEDKAFTGRDDVLVAGLLSTSIYCSAKIQSISHKK